MTAHALLWQQRFRLLLLGLCLLGCDRPSDRLQGQSNATITFYGMAVDHEGQPLEGALIRYQVDAYPDDWTFDTRGRPYVTTEAVAKSDRSGNFKFEARGCILRLLEASRMGYRHLVDQHPPGHTGTTEGIRLIAWGQQLYKSDPERPAVFVFVKDGVKEVSALPSRGGYFAWGKEWRPNRPAWPKKPSLPDVVYKPPATQPGEFTAEPQR
jgi:hypothetical protein